MNSPKIQHWNRPIEKYHTDTDNNNQSILPTEDAVNDLKKSLHASLSCIIVAIENQIILLEAINQPFKNFVRNNEDKISKRKREKEPKEKGKKK